MKKEYDYVVTLEHPGKGWIRIMNLFMTLMGLALLAIVPLSSERAHPFMYIPVGLALALAMLTLISEKWKKPIKYSWVLTITGLLIVYMPLPYSTYIGILYILAAIGFSAAQVDPEIAFNSEGIVINNLFPTKKSWETIDRALIKDDILTLEFSGNKLYQKTLNEPVSAALTEEFNHFCEQQIQAARPVSAT